ncbi:MAG: macro domain-containing protein [Bacilli bacterium]|nr:macro domain-containing protein [Bacilli bacterium]
MKIYIIERNKDNFKYLVPYFDDLEDVVLVNTDFKTFMDEYYVECIVSPANSYGLMDGGYDKAIKMYFKEDIQEKVQNYIIKNYYGEQPIYTSFIIDINDKQKLMHTPTMRIPEKIIDERAIYQCMRSVLIEAKQNNIESILIPMFGGLTGGVHPQNISKMMRLAYDQIQNPPEKISWEYVKKLK